jgi:hypothetical protein
MLGEHPAKVAHRPRRRLPKEMLPGSMVTCKLEWQAKVCEVMLVKPKSADVQAGGYPFEPEPIPALAEVVTADRLPVDADIRLVVFAG